MYADGTEVTNVAPIWTKAGDVWTYTFKDVPKIHEGKEITYTVTEDAVPGYQTSQTGLDITNTKIEPPIELVSINGTKTWVDQSNQSSQRPLAITVRLYADGKEVQNVKPVWSKADNVWYYEFANLPKFAGVRSIEYTVREDAVPGYTTQIEGFDITNTLNPKPVLPETGLADKNYGWILIAGGFVMMLASRMKRRPKH